MTTSKNAYEQSVYFTDCLKNSSTTKEWIEQEKRVSDLIVIPQNLDTDFQDLHAQEPTNWFDLLNYSTSKDKLRKEFLMYLPMLKDTFQGHSMEILCKWKTNLKNVLGIGAKDSKVSGA